MKLIVGLGNPGKKYFNTKHNVGFIVLDQWAQSHGEAFNQSKFDGEYFETMVNGEKVMFLEPQTYMNLSGESVIQVMNYYHLTPEDVLIVYDDMDIVPGKIRLRLKGSAGGHNGMKNIIQHTKAQNVQRLKVGIGRPEPYHTVVDHVLTPFPKKDQEAMLDGVEQAIDAIDYWLSGETFENTMNQFN